MIFLPPPKILESAVNLFSFCLESKKWIECFPHSSFHLRACRLPFTADPSLSCVFKSCPVYFSIDQQCNAKKRKSLTNNCRQRRDEFWRLTKVFCTCFLAKFETKKRKRNVSLCLFVEDMTRAKKMANNFRVTVFSEVYEIVFDDCMKTVEHSKSTQKKSGPRSHFPVLMLKNFHCRFEQF